VYEACVNAVKLELSQSKDVVLTDIEDGPIDLSAIPF
jgi:hypothetical protein